jgi:hypothetical protein
MDATWCAVVPVLGSFGEVTSLTHWVIVAHPVAGRGARQS